MVVNGDVFVWTGVGLLFEHCVSLLLELTHRVSTLPQVERERSQLLLQTFKQLNTQYNRRTANTGAPLLVHRVKVTFKEEPGEGSGVARSFYTAFAQVGTLAIVYRQCL